MEEHGEKANFYKFLVMDEETSQEVENNICWMPLANDMGESLNLAIQIENIFSKPDRLHRNCVECFVLN